jgi:hypothetical protein
MIDLQAAPLSKEILRRLIMENCFLIREEDAWEITRLFEQRDILVCWKSRHIVILSWGIAFTWSSICNCGYKNQGRQ